MISKTPKYSDRKQNFLGENMFRFNFPVYQQVDNNQRKLSISVNEKCNNKTKKNSLASQNEGVLNKSRNIFKSSKNNIYSPRKKKSLLSKENNPFKTKKKSCVILEPKNYFERHSSDSSVISNNNNNTNNLKNSFIQIQNQLKNEINKMKNFLNKKQKQKNKTRSSCSNVCVNILKENKKEDGDLSIFPIFAKEDLIKKSKSFDFTEQSRKNLRNRIKNKIKDNINNLTVIKNKDNNSSDYDDDSNKINKNERYISFSPNSNVLLIYDILLIISNLYSFIFIPLSIAKNENLIEKELTFKEIIKYYNDFIYMLDFFITSVRGYYNFEMEIIRDNKGILIHYLKQDFFNDLIEGIPVYILLRLFNDNKYFHSYHSYIFDYDMFFIKLFLFIKSFKIFKITGNKKSKALEDFYRYLSVFYYLEKAAVFIFSFIIFLLFIHLFICLHIFFALQSYPNWISYSNVANEDFIKKYVASFYFLMTTVTTVGYGDIVCISIYERLFHIILLGIGTIIYSFIVSKIGNYLREESYVEMKLSKDLTILENIRLAHPSMPFNLYLKIKNHLLNISKKRKKTELSLLINGIPEAIKNELLFKIYAKVIKNFKIFKGANNSHFIIQVLTSFIPIVSKKNETLVLEGDPINNMVFIKDGRITLEISIDLNDPYKSIQDYLIHNFNGISRKKEMIIINNAIRRNAVIKTDSEKFIDLKGEIDNLIQDKQKSVESENYNGISMDLGRLNFTMNKNEKSMIEENYELIKIMDIRKNEHFGEIFMFLQKPSPFTLTVKSRLAELFLLRKHDAVVISETYPNIWKKIYTNSYHNLVSIKELIHKILTRYYNTYFYNKDNKIINMSKLDATILSKLTRKNSVNSDISRVIRKTQTLTRYNSTIYNKKNSRKNSNQIRFSEDLTYNDISFSDSLSYTTSIKKNEKSDSSSEDKNKNDKTSNNEEPATTPFKKFTFKITSPTNKVKNNGLNKESLFSKGFNKINTVESSMAKSSKTAAFKNMDKSSFDNEDNNNTEKISNYSSNKNGFLILEDINTDFSKKIKKQINKRAKIEKIRNLFELQKKIYINSLNEFYSQIINQDLNINDYNNIFFNIQKQLNEVSSKNIMFSKIIDSEEEKSNISTHRNTQFDTNTLKKIKSESFEIKSSYENINKLSNGEIVKNLKYKCLLGIIIKKYLNNDNFNEEDFKEILSKKIENNKKKEILEKGKENDNYNSYKDREKHVNFKNIFTNKNKTLILKSKILDLSRKKKFSRKTLDKVTNYGKLNEHKIEIKKSKRNIHISEKNIQNHPKITGMKRESDSTIKKESKKSLCYKNIKTEEQKRNNKQRRSDPAKKEKENENNIYLTSSANAIVDFDKDIISNNGLDALNNIKNTNKNNSKYINKNENNGKCIII